MKAAEAAKKALKDEEAAKIKAQRDKEMEEMQVSYSISSDVQMQKKLKPSWIDHNTAVLDTIMETAVLRLCQAPAFENMLP